MKRVYTLAILLGRLSCLALTIVTLLHLIGLAGFMPDMKADGAVRVNAVTNAVYEKYYCELLSDKFVLRDEERLLWQYHLKTTAKLIHVVADKLDYPSNQGEWNDFQPSADFNALSPEELAVAGMLQKKGTAIDVDRYVFIEWDREESAYAKIPFVPYWMKAAGNGVGCLLIYAPNLTLNAAAWVYGLIQVAILAVWLTIWHWVLRVPLVTKLRMIYEAEAEDEDDDDSESA